jgi:hypothetical protein
MNALKRGCRSQAKSANTSANDKTVRSRRFRPVRHGTRIAPTHDTHVFREEHRWPSASP